MLVNILVFAFVDAFVAIAALGHVLLFLAIWPVWPSGPNKPAFSKVGQQFAICKDVFALRQAEPVDRCEVNTLARAPLWHNCNGSHRSRERQLDCGAGPVLAAAAAGPLLNEGF